MARAPSHRLLTGRRQRKKAKCPGNHDLLPLPPPVPSSCPCNPHHLMGRGRGVVAVAR